MHHLSISTNLSFFLYLEEQIAHRQFFSGMVTAEKEEEEVVAVS
jgi:hypothetical protein